MKRRPLLAGVLGGLVAPALAGEAVAQPSLGPDAVAERATAAGPPTVTPADIRFAPRTLRPGSAQQAGLVAAHVERIAPDAASFLTTTPPFYPGYVVLAAHRGVIVTHAVGGHALRYSGYAAGTPVELPPEQWVPMREDTIFDMASVSKLFTAVAAMQQVERGRLDLDAPVVRYVPEFGVLGKESITVRQLLTHSSGMPEWKAIYREPTYEARIAAVYNTPLKAPPGTAYYYSDLNLITLGKVIEKVGGASLDVLVRDGVTAPLGMRDTGYNPPDRARCAATEHQPWTRPGVIRGEVHDENAWSLNGVAGHAGIFSTARDMAIFAQTMLGGGRYGTTRVLREDTVRAMLVNGNVALGPAAARGLGFQLAQRFYMDALTSPITFGHTGYTGTSLVVDPLTHTFIVVLSNRVHPTRGWGTTSDYRRVVTRDLARAVPVRSFGRAWHAFGGGPASLTAPLRVPSAGGRLSFRLWYDTAVSTVAADTGALWSSADAGSTWQLVPLSLEVRRQRWSTDGSFSGFSAREWLSATATLPDGTTHVRWTYETKPDTGSGPDRDYRGRGVYVDNVLAIGRGGVLLHDASPFTPNGWTRSAV